LELRGDEREPLVAATGQVERSSLTVTELYDWFTEGFAAINMREAKAFIIEE
jgi:hypothetical protein